MSYISLEKVLKVEGSSLFKLTLASASRANELAQGAQPLVKHNSKKVSTIALQEIAEGKVRYEEPKAGKKKSAA